MTPPLTTEAHAPSTTMTMTTSSMMRNIGVFWFLLSACMMAQDGGNRVRATQLHSAAVDVDLHSTSSYSSFSSTSEPAWTYDVTAPPSNQAEDESAHAIEVEVDATFRALTTDRFVIDAPSAAFNVRDLRVSRKGAPASMDSDGDGTWIIQGGCSQECRVHYRLDLSGLAASTPVCREQLSCARRIDGAVLVSSKAWLMRPASRNENALVSVRTTNKNRTAAITTASFLSGMKPTFHALDLDEGAFTAFGKMRRISIQLEAKSGAAAPRIEVAILGAFQITDEEFRNWIADTARSLERVYGRFPVERTTLFIVPQKAASQVIFGKVLSLAGASIAIIVGDRTRASALREDWILRHELFHLGFPSFRGEGRWLIEGLAVYYEPLLRARADAGKSANADHTALASLRAQLAGGGETRRASYASLADRASRDDLESIYFGGGAFCLAADLRIRSETHGKHSLDDVLRAVLQRGGDATQVWALQEVLDVGDKATGTSTLNDLYRRHAIGTDRIDVASLFGSLGVVGADKGTSNSITFDDQQPLAWIRREIVSGPR